MITRIILPCPALRGNACDVITPRYSVIFISANSSRKPRKMGVSSRYKSRHRLEERRVNESGNLQKRHKCKGTKNALVKKAVPLAYLRGFRLFFKCKSKGASKGQKKKNKFIKKEQKIKPFHWWRLPLNLMILQDVSYVGFSFL